MQARVWSDRTAMSFFPYLPVVHEAQDPSGMRAPARSAPELFLDVLDSHLDRRRAEEEERVRRERDERAAPQAGAARAKQQQAPDFAMLKLYQSLLLRLGGPAPAVAASAPNALVLMHEALKVWRSGSRTLFARDSELYAIPQYPVTRPKEN